MRIHFLFNTVVLPEFESMPTAISRIVIQEDSNLRKTFPSRIGYSYFDSS